MSDPGDDEWQREALRLGQRYIDEVVLAFGLCPWAEPSLRGGRVGRAVCLSKAPVAADCSPTIDMFVAARLPALDIGLLSFPRAVIGWAAFDAFAERVRRAHGPQGPFLIAAFHPDGPARAENPHQAVSFFRRSPDPMLQFVRAELIDRVKASQPEASAGVGQRNYRALQGDGATRLNAVIADIRADRDAAYATLALRSG